MVAIILFTSKWNIRFLYWTLKHQKFLGQRRPLRDWMLNMLPLQGKTYSLFITNYAILSTTNLQYNFVKLLPNVSSLFQYFLFQWRLQFTSSRYRILSTRFIALNIYIFFHFHNVLSQAAATPLHLKMTSSMWVAPTFTPNAMLFRR